MMVSFVPLYGDRAGVLQRPSRQPLICNGRRLRISRASSRWRMLAKYQKREESENKPDAAGLMPEPSSGISTPIAEPQGTRDAGSASAAGGPSGGGGGGGGEDDSGGPPSVSLPTLTTMGGLSEEPRVRSRSERYAEEAQQFASDPILREFDDDDAEQGFMVRAARFLVEVADEAQKIEWPKLTRVYKITVVVIASIIFSIVFVYLVDSVFYWMAQRLFETEL